MKALSLIEPWLQLILVGKKTVEFRTWRRERMEGRDLLLCSSKGWDPDCAKYSYMNYKLSLVQVDEARMLCGHARCIVRVKMITPATTARHGDQLGFSYHGDGKQTYAWELEDIRPIEPFPVKGQLGIYEVELPKEHEL